MASETSDFLSDWMEWSDGMTTPEIYRMWCGLYIIGAATERRLFIRTGNLREPTYMNLYIMLVGRIGIGKGIINRVRELLGSVPELDSNKKAFRLAQNDITNAALIDEVVDARQIKITSSGPPLVYHSLMLIYEEMQNFLNTYDPQIIGLLTELWNNPPQYSQRRRTSIIKKVELDAPQLSLLCGVQPPYLTRVFPEDAWATGLARRMMLVYHDEITKIDIFGTKKNDEVIWALMQKKLSKISAMMGEMLWAPKALVELNEWYQSDLAPVPTHSKLLGYNTGRLQTVIKLAGISAVSRNREIIIETNDLDRAKQWLLAVEALMPSVFRSMIGKSDAAVIEETMSFINMMMLRTKKPVNGEKIWEFLVERLPNFQVKTVFENMARSGAIQRVAGTEDEWVSNPRFRIGRPLE